MALDDDRERVHQPKIIGWGWCTGERGRVYHRSTIRETTYSLNKQLSSAETIIETEMILEEITRVNASPEKVYHFFETMDVNYQQWHPDHIVFRWSSGVGLEQGSIASFEERIAGTRQKKTVQFTEVIPNRYIEFKPTSLLVGILMPSISFKIDPHESGCDLTQRIKVRTGPVGVWLNRREFDAVRVHMREEGENLKIILETDEVSAL